MNSTERVEKKYDTTMLINTDRKSSDPDRCPIGNSLCKLLSGFFGQKTSLANYPICIISWENESITIYTHKNPVHILLQRMHKWKSVQALGLFILKNEKKTVLCKLAEVGWGGWRWVRKGSAVQRAQWFERGVPCRPSLSCSLQPLLGSLWGEQDLVRKENGIK